MTYLTTNNKFPLHTFLGLAGHFRAFIKYYATKSRRLTRLAQKDEVWAREGEVAYHDLVRINSCLILFFAYQISSFHFSSTATLHVMLQVQRTTSVTPQNHILNSYRL